jgi:hypothetical protein
MQGWYNVLTYARFHALQPELLSRLPAEEMRNIYRVDIAISRLDAETNGQQPESIEQIGERA